MNSRLPIHKRTSGNNRCLPSSLPGIVIVIAVIALARYVLPLKPSGADCVIRLLVYTIHELIANVSIQTAESAIFRGIRDKRSLRKQHRCITRASTLIDDFGTARIKLRQIQNLLIVYYTPNQNFHTCYFIMFTLLYCVCNRISVI